MAVGGDGGNGLFIFIECIDFSPYHFQCLVFRADAPTFHADWIVEAVCAGVHTLMRSMILSKRASNSLIVWKASEMVREPLENLSANISLRSALIAFCRLF